MNRKTLLTGALAVLLTAAACGPTDRDIASVNGAKIAKADVFNETGELVKLQAGEGATPSASADPIEVASTIEGRIINEFLFEGLRAFGLTLDEARREEARDAFGEKPPSMSQSLFDFFVDRRAAYSQIAARVSDKDRPWYSADDVTRYYEAVKNTTYVTACTRHILVDDETKANDIRSALARGAQFATMVSDSTDTTSKEKGGDLGCNAHGAFVKEFEAAIEGTKTGDIIGPVKTSFGYHVIRVDKPYALEPLTDALRQKIGESLLTADGWLQFKAATSRVTVAPRYGTWDSATVSVRPPGAA